MKLSREIKVKNRFGLHARPSGLIVKLLQNSASAVAFTYKDNTVNARSIMGLLTLGAGNNACIRVDVDGEDAEATMQQLIEVFERQFGEERAHAG